MLELEGIVKQYPEVLANDRVDLSVGAGELHALLGENGAGKSTLVKCIYGLIHPDAGEIRWQGRPVRVASPARARELGIGMVFQHFSLFETLTVAQNVALALGPGQDMRALTRRIREVSEEYALPVDPDRHVSGLAVGERQRVEVVRCLLQDPKLLIMDEPTSVLAPQEVERLFDTLRRIAAEGRSVLYISHKLEEVRALCETATILRAGRVVATCDPREESGESITRMMIGEGTAAYEHRARRGTGEVALELRELSRSPSDPFGTALRNISLRVRGGEILGIAGVSGNGEAELFSVMSGETPTGSAADIRLCGRDAGRLGPGARRALGMACAPAERLGRAAVPDMSLADNACLTAYRQGLVRRGVVRGERVRAFVRDVIERFRVAAGGPEAPAGSLSGGNLQKFVVGRELLQNPHVLVVANPTWGVDVGSATAIRQALLDRAAAGAAVVVFSEDLTELFELCDRIAAIYEGRLSPALPVAETDRDRVGRWMMGLFEDGGTERVRGSDVAAH
ncbi:MAG TPA: ABC transporter ATP-binding protein [Gammaproteobacteria bacterium]|nr:ABC transporter ATP-binding protein [Gammaproteobacteria bacterium]